MPVTSGKSRPSPKKRAGRNTKVKTKVKRRSAAARALASPLYRKKVIKSAKAYSRKGRAKAKGEESEEA